MNLNKAFVLGNLTRDPEAKTLPSGSLVANFGVATNRVFYDKDKQKQEQTEFHNIVAFGRTAEIIQQYLKKGAMVLIEGRIQTRDWQDSNGVKHWRTEIITERLQLGPRTIGNAPSPEIPSQEKEAPEAPKEEIPIIEEKEIDVKDIPL